MSEITNKRIKDITSTASEADLVSGNYFVLDGAGVGTKKLPCDKVAKSSSLVAEKQRAEAEEARIEALFTQPVEDAVNEWLDSHPEATTSVQDNSLTNKKLVLGTLGFVTPRMFGAVGDGVENDFSSIQSCLNSGYPIDLEGKTYLLGGNGTLNIQHDLNIRNGKFFIPSQSGSVRRIFASYSNNAVKNYFIENVDFESVKDKTCADTNVSETLCSNIWLCHFSYAENLKVYNCSFQNIDYCVKCDTKIKAHFSNIECKGTLQFLQMFGNSLIFENSKIYQDLNANSLYHCVYEHGSTDEVSNDSFVNCVFVGNSYPIHCYNKNVVSRNVEITGCKIDGNIPFLNTGNGEVTIKNSEIIGNNLSYQTKKISIYNSFINIKQGKFVDGISDDGNVIFENCDVVGYLIADSFVCSFFNCNIIAIIGLKINNTKTIFDNCRISAPEGTTSNHISLYNSSNAVFTRCLFNSYTRTFYLSGYSGSCLVKSCTFFSGNAGLSSSWVASENNCAVFASIR